VRDRKLKFFLLLLGEIFRYYNTLDANDEAKKGREKTRLCRGGGKCFKLYSKHVDIISCKVRRIIVALPLSPLSLSPLLGT
jgi:hypothetical protein